jgi:putative ABC transport system substrate-binding protein
MRRWLCGLTLAFFAGLATAAPSVWLALSAEGGIYAETVALLQAELGTRGVPVSVRAGTWAQLRLLPPEKPDLVITLGLGALERVAEASTSDLALADIIKDAPVLAGLLPRSAYESIAPKLSGRQRSGVFIDPSAGVLFDLIRRAMPERRRVGILAGPATEGQLPVLRQQAKARGLNLIAATTGGDDTPIYPALKSVLAESDVLLALPDVAVFNGSNLPNILMASYRARVPMVAFSEPYVRAGAVAAVFYTPLQMSKALADQATAWLRRKEFLPAAAPVELSIAINDKVLGSLGMSLDSAAALKNDLMPKGAGR